MTTSPRYHVFLSHHAADQPAVEAIARLLRAADLTPFLDRWHLVPGDPWMEAIEQALASSETVAVFVGPSGIGPWQNEEMRVALYESAVRGKRVIPVLLPGADPQRVARFLTRRTWVDFRAGPEDAGALQRLIAGIQGLPSEAGGYLSPLDLAPPKHYFTPFQAPPLPPYFVPRPEAAEAIRAALLDARSDMPGVLAISAIHGLGGIGKTTLIAALAHDPAVRQRYPDGILWVTLGKKPKVFPRLLDWIQQLGDYTFKPTTLEGASSHLRTLLIDKACLLVVDDAWQREHVDNFLVGGPRSQAIITTRDATLARKLHARLHDLDVMSEEQALALIHGRLGPLSFATESAQASALARELGYLPLALELATAQVESGRSWSELLTHFRSAHADLAILDLDEPTCRNESLRVSFALSLDSLSDEDQITFVWFGVLPEDAIIEPAMAASLWDETDVRTRQRLRRLRDKALLKPAGEDRYTLHDLIHDEARVRLAKQMPVYSAHAAFLDRYRTKARNGMWHTLPDDGYIHAHLTWHMEQAGQLDAIHDLLREETDDGRNGWYSTLDRFAQTDVFIDSIVRAKQIATERTAIGYECRYALVLASLNSLANNIPADLLLGLVNKGCWPPLQALVYARRIPDLPTRVKVLGQLISYFEGPTRAEVLLEVLAVTEGRHDWDTQSSLVSGLDPRRDPFDCTSDLSLEPFTLFSHELKDKDDLDRALNKVWQNQSSSARASALSALSPFLTEKQVGESLAQILRIRFADDRARVRMSLAYRLVELGCPEEALDVVRKIDLKDDRIAALGFLALALAKHNYPNLAVQVTWMLPDFEDRIPVIVRIARYLPDQTLDVVFRYMRREVTIETCARTLGLYLPAPLLEELLEETIHIDDTDIHARTQSELAIELCRLGNSEQALRVVKCIVPNDLRVLALAAVSSCLSQGAISDTVEAVLAVESSQTRISALALMAPNLPQVSLAYVLKAILETKDSDDWMHTLEVLAPHLPQDLLLRSFIDTMVNWDTKLWQHMLPVLARYMSASEIRTITGKAYHSSDVKRKLDSLASGSQLDVLASIANYLPEDLVQQYVRDALKGRYEFDLSTRVSLADYQSWDAVQSGIRGTQERHPGFGLLTRVALVSRLQQSQLEQVMAEVMNETDEVRQRQLLLTLAPHIPTLWLNYALSEMRQLQTWRRGSALRKNLRICLGPELANRGQPGEAITLISEIYDSRTRTEVLGTLIPRLMELNHVQEALQALQKLEDGVTRDSLTVLLIPKLVTITGFEATLSMATSIRDAELRSHALRGLVGQASDSQVRRIVQHVDQFRVPKLQEQLIAACAARLAQLGQLDEAIAMSVALQDGKTMASAIAGITPCLLQTKEGCLHGTWLKVFDALSGRTRKDLLLCLRSLVPGWIGWRQKAGINDAAPDGRSLGLSYGQIA